MMWMKVNGITVDIRLGAYIICLLMNGQNGGVRCTVINIDIIHKRLIGKHIHFEKVNTNFIFNPNFKYSYYYYSLIVVALKVMEPRINPHGKSKYLMCVE